MSASHVHAASNNNLPVIIIGGGLAGLSLSLGLASLGFQVEIVEQQPNFSRTGATFGLALNGQKALEELCPGIVSDLKLVGLDLDPPDIAIMLGWWDVRDALLDRVMKNKNVITIRHGWLLQDIKDDDDDASVKAAFYRQKQDQNEDREQLLLEGCMLFGADGVNSSVRSLLGLACANHTGVLTWRARVQIPPTLRVEVQDADTCHGEMHGTKEQQDAMLSTLRPMVESPLKAAFFRIRGPMNYALFNFNEKTPGTMALVVNIQGDGEQTASKKGTSPKAIMEEHAESDDERKEIRAILEFVTDKDGLNSPTPMKVVEPPMEAGAGWGGKGRITIVGDAAHAMRPASGQGGSMAFEDSVMLCRALAKAKSQDSFNDKAGTQRALREFENSRIPRVRNIWVDQRERAESIYKKNTKPMEPWTDEYRAWVYEGV